MNREATLHKALDIATAQGFNVRDIDRNRKPSSQCRGKMTGLYNNVVRFEHNSADFHAIIFNWRFARALWPKHDWDNETTFCRRCGVSMASTAGYSKTDCFYEMLQSMVIADDPIEYLGTKLP